MSAQIAAEAGLDPQKAKGLAMEIDAELAMRELLGAKARELGIDKEPKVQAAVELAKLAALDQAYLERVEAGLEPDEKDLRLDYDSAYPEKALVNAKFAIFAKRDAAAAALERASKGLSTMEQEAAKGDDQLLARAGGDVGWIAFDALPEQVAKAIDASPARWPSAPVATAYGHVVYEFIGRRLGREMSYEQAKPELAKRRRQLMMRAKLAALKAEAGASAGR